VFFLAQCRWISWIFSNTSLYFIHILLFYSVQIYQVVVVNLNWLKERGPVSSPAPPWWKWIPVRASSKGDRKSDNYQHYSADGFQQSYPTEGPQWGSQWWDGEEDWLLNVLLFVSSCLVLPPNRLRRLNLGIYFKANVESLPPNPPYVSWLRFQGE